MGYLNRAQMSNHYNNTQENINDTPQTPKTL